MARDTKIVKQLSEACRIMGEWEMTHGSEGHISYWDGESPSVLIRGKGKDQLGVRYTRDSDIVEVDFEGNTLEGGTDGVRSPSEIYLHTCILKANPELRSVVHMHPRAALILTACEKPILPIHGRNSQGARIAVDGIDVYPTSITIHTQEMGEKFAAFVGKKRHALMRGHGITVAGTSIEEATVHALELNELLKLNYEAYLVGDPKPLPQGDIDHLRREPETNRPRGSAGGEEGMLANYKYYGMVAGEIPVK